MDQTINFPLCAQELAPYGSWGALQTELSGLGISGLEGIWSGEDFPKEMPSDLIQGYHLMFYSDWLDFYRGNKTALIQKFGNIETVNYMCGGTDPALLLEQYRLDLERAAALKVKYVVFHVSDVSIQETYTYRWLHSHEEVIDGAIEIINLLLGDRDWPFEFLVENQWWRGFTFTNPVLTVRLLTASSIPERGLCWIRDI